MTASTEVNQEQADPNQAVQVVLQAGEGVLGDRQEGEEHQAGNLEGEVAPGDHRVVAGVQAVLVGVAALQVLDQEAPVVKAVVAV